MTKRVSSLEFINTFALKVALFSQPSMVNKLSHPLLEVFDLISPDFYFKMLHEKQIFLTGREYQHLASEVGFNQVSIKIENKVIEWKNLDVFINAMHGVFHGQFDSAKMDGDALGKLIEDYGKDTAVKRHTRIIKAVLTK